MSRRLTITRGQSRGACSMGRIRGSDIAPARTCLLRYMRGARMVDSRKLTFVSIPLSRLAPDRASHRRRRARWPDASSRSSAGARWLVTAATALVVMCSFRRAEGSQNKAISEQTVLLIGALDLEAAHWEGADAIATDIEKGAKEGVALAHKSSSIGRSPVYDQVISI